MVPANRCAGRQDVFVASMMVYAVANACIGATPAAYAADVMPQSVSGFGLGIYRCAGDIGAAHWDFPHRICCIPGEACSCIPPLQRTYQSKSSILHELVRSHTGAPPPDLSSAATV